MTAATLDRSTAGGGFRRPRRRPGRTALRLVPLLPAVALMLVFLAGPVLWSFYGSLTNQALTGYKAANPEFVGLDNYADLLTDDGFWKAVVLTVVFVGASAVIGQNVLGMALALLLRAAARPLRAVVSALVVVAWVLPEIVAAFALYAFFSTDGTLNQVLGWFGLEGPTWLISVPMLAVILANIWRGTAFSMMVYGAALSEVPPDVTEAAAIDGATGPQRFFRITLPMIRRSISTNLMLTTLQTLAVFTLIWVMTGGGPGTDSSTLPVLAYQEAFKFAQVGYGTAIATVTLLVGAVFSIVYIRVLKPEVD
ncbi:sugar ABC transporter permease [Cellulomonas sp. IC4_254]|uniref:carbohydrate ABC transporter permease n=1 Tax=Cellulomonas sp. IC4_254 TaxID=2714040 RepID=UPI00141E1B12|nr:sugar ABC transporter permease [Cellulomonas sp. IC4_254]NHT17875.1 sugar ABC transporter permease [Cellulomonas sp. IC4_254]